MTAAEGFGIASAAVGAALLLLAAISAFRLVVADLRGGFDGAEGALFAVRSAALGGLGVGLVVAAGLLLRR